MSAECGARGGLAAVLHSGALAAWSSGARQRREEVATWQVGWLPAAGGGASAAAADAVGLACFAGSSAVGEACLREALLGASGPTPGAAAAPAAGAAPLSGASAAAAGRVGGDGIGKE